MIKNWYKYIIILSTFIFIIVSFSKITFSATPGRNQWIFEEYEPSSTKASKSIPGTIKWSLNTSIILGAPVIANDGTIYIEETEHLIAISPDGNIKWRSEIPGCEHLSSPAISNDGTVYVIAFLDPASYFYNNGTTNTTNYIYAINPNGQIKWKVALPYNNNTGWGSAPAIGTDGTIYIPDNGNLYAINPNGQIKWKIKFSNNTYTAGGTPVIGTDGTIYISDNRDLYAINPNGQIKWTCNISSQKLLLAMDFSAPVIGKDNTIYIVGIGYSNYCLYAINPNGQIKWKTGNLGSYPSETESVAWEISPVIGKDGTIYIEVESGNYNNCVYAISPKGQIKWKIKLPYFNTIECPAIGRDGTVYVVTPNLLYAINSSSGGLANSPWPKFQHDNQNTGNVLNNIIHGINSDNITVTPDTVDFGNVTIGDSSTQDVLIKNKGTQTVYLKDILIYGANATSFIALNGTSSLIKPNSSLSLKIKFIPQYQEEEKATLHIKINETDFYIKLKGKSQEQPQIIDLEPLVPIEKIIYNPIIEPKYINIYFLATFNKDISGLIDNSTIAKYFSLFPDNTKIRIYNNIANSNPILLKVQVPINYVLENSDYTLITNNGLEASIELQKNIIPITYRTLTDTHVKGGVFLCLGATLKLVLSGHDIINTISGISFGMPYEAGGKLIMDGYYYGNDPTQQYFSFGEEGSIGKYLIQMEAGIKGETNNKTDLLNIVDGILNVDMMKKTIIFMDRFNRDELYNFVKSYYDNPYSYLYNYPYSYLYSYLYNVKTTDIKLIDKNINYYSIEMLRQLRFSINTSCAQINIEIPTLNQNPIYIKNFSISKQNSSKIRLTYGVKITLTHNRLTNMKVGMNILYSMNTSIPCLQNFTSILGYDHINGFGITNNSTVTQKQKIMNKFYLTLIDQLSNNKTYYSYIDYPILDINPKNSNINKIINNILTNLSTNYLSTFTMVKRYIENSSDNYEAKAGLGAGLAFKLYQSNNSYIKYPDTDGLFYINHMYKNILYLPYYKLKDNRFYQILSKIQNPLSISQQIYESVKKNSKAENLKSSIVRNIKKRFITFTYYLTHPKKIYHKILSITKPATKYIAIRIRYLNTIKSKAQSSFYKYFHLKIDPAIIYFYPKNNQYNTLSNIEAILYPQADITANNATLLGVYRFNGYGWQYVASKWDNKYKGYKFKLTHYGYYALIYNFSNDTNFMQKHIINLKPQQSTILYSREIKLANNATAANVEFEIQPYKCASIEGNYTTYGKSPVVIPKTIKTDQYGILHIPVKAIAEGEAFYKIKSKYGYAYDIIRIVVSKNKGIDPNFKIAIQLLYKQDKMVPVNATVTMKAITSYNSTSIKWYIKTPGNDVIKKGSGYSITFTPIASSVYKVICMATDKNGFWHTAYALLPVTNPNKDSDGDGISDNVEKFFGLNPKDPSDGKKFISAVENSKNCFIKIISGQGTIENVKKLPARYFDNIPNNLKPICIYNYTVNNMSVGGSVELQALFNITNLENYEIYRFVNNRWIDISNQVSYNTDSITYYLTDGGKYDNDGLANGKIEDTIMIAKKIATATWQDITSALKITKSRPIFDRYHRCFLVYVNIKNTSGQDIYGPIRLIITNPTLPIDTNCPLGIQVAGKTSNGNSYFEIIPKGGVLKAGASTGNLRINFKLARKRLSFGVAIEQLEQIGK